MTTCFNACMLMVNCFPHALWAKTWSRFFFQSTDLLNHCENIESSVAYIYSWIYGLCLNHQFITFLQKKKYMNFNTILQECIHAVSLIYIPFFLKWKMKVMNKRIKELTKKSVSTIAHVPHTLYQIQSYAETRCCQDFGNLPRDRSKHMQILNSS